MKIILDANIWISFLFGKQLQSVSLLLTNPNVKVYVSPNLIAELLDVLSRPKVSKYISEESIEAMWEVMREHCEVIEGYPTVEAPIRDVKDLYILSMAKVIPVDFIVTGDKDLLVLGKYENSSIITFREMMLVLEELCKSV